jgi:hypothetical protein
MLILPFYVVRVALDERAFDLFNRVSVIELKEQTIV